MRMLIEIYFTKVTQVNFPNTALTWIISCSLPMQPTNLSRLQIQYAVSTGSCRKQRKKSVYFPYIDSDLGYFALITTSGLRIKEFPLYGTDNYYKMVGKKSMQKIFFRVERFPFERSPLLGIFTVLLFKTLM